MNMRVSRGGRQGGSMMLEALIAILIFSVGILAIVGMQGSAVRATSDAKYRSDAGMLANNLIGQMWGGDRSAIGSPPVIPLQTNFQGGNGTDGPLYSAWAGDPLNPDPYSIYGALPGSITNPPTVTVAPILSGATVTGFQVSIQIQWLAPGDPVTTQPHSYIVVTQIAAS